MLVEKVLGASAAIDDRMVDVYHASKRSNGYTSESIARKAAALEGVLVPLTAAMNEQLLRGAGFAEIDSFWLYMNFRGWLAIKSRQ